MTGHTRTVVAVLLDAMQRKGLERKDLAHPGAELRSIQRFLPHRASTEPSDIPGRSIDAMLGILGVSHVQFYRAMATTAKRADS